MRSSVWEEGGANSERTASADRITQPNVSRDELNTPPIHPPNQVRVIEVYDTTCNHISAVMSTKYDNSGAKQQTLVVCVKKG
jgi:hypothetical protein